MSLEQLQSKPAGQVNDGLVVLTGAAVVLVVLVEALRHVGKHPAVVRAKTSAKASIRVPRLAAGEATVLALVWHYLYKIGANVLGVRARGA